MKRIVVIDDELAVAKSVARMLRVRGYVSEIATSGAAGIELVNCTHPQLVITDMRMPVLSGADVFHALRASPRTCHIPVLIISAYSSEQCEGCGDAHLQKPFLMSDLLQAVDSLIPKALPEQFTQKSLSCG